MKTPEFPPPDSRDAPEVALALRNAAAFWAAGRHRDALPLLMRAAATAQTKTEAPKSDMRVVELAMAATEIAAFVHSGEDPRSIPVSLDFSVGSVDIESIDIESAAIQIIAPPGPPPARPVHTMREDERPASSPDTHAAPPVKLAPPTAPVDLTQTLPQGAKLENVPKLWQYAKAKAPVPTPKPMPAVKEAKPAEEPAPPSDPHGAPTRRMEDVETKRDPHDKR